MKTCTKCGEPKQLEEFPNRPPRTGQAGYIEGTCIVCRRLATRAWKKANKSAVDAANKDWRQRNPDKVQRHRKDYRSAHKAEFNAYMRQYSKDHPRARCAYNRARSNTERTNITGSYILSLLRKPGPRHHPIPRGDITTDLVERKRFWIKLTRAQKKHGNSTQFFRLTAAAAAITKNIK